MLRLLKLAAEEVLQAALSFPKGSAAGPSGFRPSHLREVLMCGISKIESTALTALTDFINLCASGTLPIEIAPNLIGSLSNSFPQKLFERRLCSWGVRPIASGETLRRLVTKCVLKKVQEKFKAIVTPLQCGVAVSDAVNSIAFTMRQYYEVLQTEPQLGLMQIDLCNAFNSVDRTPILQFVCSKLPEGQSGCSVQQRRCI